MFKKRASNHDCCNAHKADYERGGDSQFIKPICATCEKKHFGNCLADTNGCFFCGKDDYTV